jgi:hypothetical protein
MAFPLLPSELQGFRTQQVAASTSGARIAGTFLSAASVDVAGASS